MSQENKRSPLDKEFDSLIKEIEPTFEWFTKGEERAKDQPHSFPGGALLEKHEIFIREMITHGNRRLAYKAAYPSSGDAAACTSAARLLAMPHIAYHIQKGLLAARQLSIQALKEQYANRLADIEEKRAVLAQIIRGELVMERETTDKKGDKQYVKVIVDPKDRIRAIMLDNQMEEEWKQAIVLPNKGITYAE